MQTFPYICEDCCRRRKAPRSNSDIMVLEIMKLNKQPVQIWSSKMGKKIPVSRSPGIPNVY